MMQEPAPSVATAQHFFNTKDAILNPLNTSAELDEYTVEDVNLKDSTVNVRHNSTIQERYAQLKADEKPKNQRLKRLEDKVEDLENKVAELKKKLKDDDADMHRWELLSRSIQGLNLFLWRTVLRQQQRNKLHTMGINTFEQLRDRAKGFDASAQIIYSTIPKQYKDILWTMGTHRHEIYQQRRIVAHPPVTRQEFLAYIHASFPDFEVELYPMSELQRSDDSGHPENLFINDTV
jgi:hypothetical protein